MELSEIRVGDVIWNVDTGHTGRVSSVAGTKMVLLDPTGEETPFYFVAEFIALLQKRRQRASWRGMVSRIES